MVAVVVLIELIVVVLLIAVIVRNVQLSTSLSYSFLGHNVSHFIEYCNFKQNIGTAISFFVFSHHMTLTYLPHQQRD